MMNGSRVWQNGGMEIFNSNQAMNGSSTWLNSNMGNFNDNQMINSNLSSNNGVRNW